MTQDIGSLHHNPTLPIHALGLPSEALTGKELEYLIPNLPGFQAPAACPEKGQLGPSESVNTITNPTMT